ncbi:hypothetical protein SPBR_08085 [Sporothrix brasiliensis 5110]|uniref:non-specific serine/threonine protein kinase n=1 Tax=Sporothrix brasiliensis 5110 TaxID=1398154 RepID=A0A0C2IHI8_9PEZI|nr:uncharacterized protein SPBR_08085 [Sporothrix brasiliensis 5110]KIH86480.1 hypothetical protein SPBR_08085 [Sporothrix brasiliensis 5110]
MADEKTIFIVKGDDWLLGNKANDQFQRDNEQAGGEDDSASEDVESVYADHGTPAPNHSVRLILRITTNNVPKNAHLGFVIGGDEAMCDILLNDKRISAKHLAVQPNLTFNTVLVKNHSQHGTKVAFTRLQESITLKNTRVLLEHEKAAVSFGDHLEIHIERFAIPTGWAEFCANQRIQANLPALDSLALGPAIATTNASKRAPVYFQDRQLGTGASAQVFRAVEKYTGNVYAIKLYHMPQLARWQEAETLERLRHKHVVRYVAYNRTAGRPTELVMEYVEGPNLEEVLDPGHRHAPLDVFEARDVIHQLLQAVSHLHSKDVVHRDIKPANVIVARRSPVYIKLVDFGSATSTAPFKSYWGTPWYTAPEYLSRQMPRTEKVDVYSVGVIALQLLFGVTWDLATESGPTSGLQSCVAAIVQQKEALAAVAERFPVPFDFVSALLSERPEGRLSAAEGLQHMVFRPGVDLGSCPGPSGVVPEMPTEVLTTADGHQEPAGAGAGADVDVGPYAQYAEYVAYAQGDAGLLDLYGDVAVEAGMINLRTPDYPQASEAVLRSRSTGRTSLLGPRSGSHQSRRLLSTASARHKRQKQDHTSARGRGRSSFVRSGAPSPLSGRDAHSSHALTPDGQVDQENGEAGGDGLHNDSDYRLPGIDEGSAVRVGAIPDTASWGGMPSSSHGSSGKTSTDNESQSEADLYDGCWMDPSHDLGAGSFLGGVRQPATRRRRASPPASLPASDRTPTFHSLSSLGDMGHQDAAPPGADGAHGVDNGLRAADRAEAAGSIRRRESLRDDARFEPTSGAGALTEAPVVIDGHVIATDDDSVSITDILDAARPASADRNRYRSRLEERGVVVQRRGQPWVPVLDGCFLCQALRLDLGPLLVRYALDPEVLLGNYLLLPDSLSPELRVLWWNQVAIVFSPQTYEINLTHLFKAYGFERNVITSLLQESAYMSRSSIRGVMQGTYAALQDVYRLCIVKSLNAEPVRSIAATCGLVLYDEGGNAEADEDEGDEDGDDVEYNEGNEGDSDDGDDDDDDESNHDQHDEHDGQNATATDQGTVLPRSANQPTSAHPAGQGNRMPTAQLPDQLSDSASAFDGLTMHEMESRHLLNVRDVFAAASTPSRVRQRYYHLLRAHGVLTERGSQAWVPLKDGCFVYQVLGRDRELRLLLEQASMRPSVLQGNYLRLRHTLPPQYSVLWWRDAPIFYMPDARTVNGRQLFKMFGKNANWLKSRCGGTTVLGARFHGYYIDVVDADNLCRMNRFDMEPIRAISAELGR